MIRECLLAAKGLYAEETISAVAEELRRHDSRYLKMITPPFFQCTNMEELERRICSN